MRFLFEDYALDTDRRELQRGAAVVSVTPQVFDLLDYLIRNRERVVSKDDLIDALGTDHAITYLEDVRKQVKWKESGPAADDSYNQRQKAREDLGLAILPRLLRQFEIESEPSMKACRFMMSER